MKNIDAEIETTRERIENLRNSLDGLEKSLESVRADLERELKMLTARHKKLVLSKLPECGTCGGSGLIDPGYQNVGCDCPDCGGSGRSAGRRSAV